MKIQIETIIHSRRSVRRTEKMACKLHVLVLHFCAIISVVNSQNKEYECPEFNRNLCKESPTHENKIIYGCTLDDDCGDYRKCCNDCRYTYRICTEVGIEEFASSQNEYLKNKYCPKVKPCFTPVKYDLRYRCGSDEVCPYGYKCCRSGCYVHRVCIPPVDEEEKEIIPPPTTTVQPQTTAGAVTEFTTASETPVAVSSTLGDDGKQESTDQNPTTPTFSPVTIPPAITTTFTAETSSKIHVITQTTNKVDNISSGFTNDGDDEVKISSEASTGNETQLYDTTTPIHKTTVASGVEFSTVKMQIPTKFPKTTQKFIDAEGSGDSDDFSGSGDDGKFEIPEPITNISLPSTLPNDLGFSAVNATFFQRPETTSTTTVVSVSNLTTVAQTPTQGIEEIGSGDGFTDDEDMVNMSQSTKSTIIPTTTQEKLNINFSTENFTRASSTVTSVEGSDYTNTDHHSTLIKISSPQADYETITPLVTNSTTTTRVSFHFHGKENSTGGTTIQQVGKLTTWSTLDANPTDVEGSGDSDDEDLAFPSTLLSAKTTTKLPTKPTPPNTPTTGDFDYDDETLTTTITVKQTLKGEGNQVSTTTLRPEETPILQVATTQQAKITTPVPDMVTTSGIYVKETTTSITASTERQSSESEKATSTVNLETKQSLNHTLKEDNDLGFFTDKEVPFRSTVSSSSNDNVKNATTTTASASTLQESLQNATLSPKNFSDVDLEDGSGDSDDEDFAFTSTFPGTKITTNQPTNPTPPNTPTTGDFDYEDETTTVKQTLENATLGSKQEQTSILEATTAQLVNISTLKPDAVSTPADYLNETTLSSATSTGRQFFETEKATTSIANLENQQPLGITTKENDDSDKQLPSFSTTTLSSKIVTYISGNATPMSSSASTFEESLKNSSGVDLEDGSGVSDDEDLSFTVETASKVNSHFTLLPDDIRDEGKTKFATTANDDFIYEENTTSFAQTPQPDLLPDVIEGMDVLKNENATKDDSTSTLKTENVEEKLDTIGAAPDSTLNRSNATPVLHKRFNESLISMLGETADSREPGSGDDPDYNGDEEDGTDDGDDVDEQIRKNFDLK